MAQKPYLSVIVPIHNETNRFPITLIDIDKHLRDVDFDYEILVVSDGANDNTADIAYKFEPFIKGLRFIQRETNKGKGYAVREGMREAKGQFRLFMDADNATSVDHFFKMIPYLDKTEEEKYDIVIGSRRVKGSKLAFSRLWHRCIAGDIGNVIIQIFLLFGIRDARCGFKCFSEESAERVFPLIKINRLAADVEALILGKKMGYKIKEIPITWENDVNSRIKTADYINMLIDVIKIRIWLWTNKYKISK